MPEVDEEPAGNDDSDSESKSIGEPHGGHRQGRARNSSWHRAVPQNTPSLTGTLDLFFLLELEYTNRRAYMKCTFSLFSQVIKVI
jgi:hypothetical protein